MRYLSSFIIIAIVLFSSCKKGDTDTSPTPMFASDFPTTVGSQWVYKRTDSLWHVVDTLTVKIIEDATSPNSQPTKMWQLVHNNRIDTTYYMIVADTALVCVANFNFYTQKLAFPYDVGKTYSNGAFYNTILDRSDIVVSNVLFSKTFHTYYSYELIEYSFKQESWVEKRVGIVKQHTTASSWDTGSSANYTIELLSTNIR